MTDVKQATRTTRTITLPAGQVRGTVHDGVATFYSIPYASPLRGRARFLEPEPPEAWAGVRDATMPGSTAPAPVRTSFGLLDATPIFGPGWITGEEYLTLTIWAPDEQSDALPVLVFLHGGGFVAGSSRIPLINGANLARHGVVVVAVQYRLGLPGWLLLEAAPANRGLLDQVAALEWVRDNVGAFGGDARAVTLAGQSAGAIAVAALLAAPSAQGLFQRAISQSGSGIAVFNLEQASKVADGVARHLGVRLTPDALGGIPDEKLVEASTAVAGVMLDTDVARDPLLGITAFLPVIQTDTLPVAPAAALAANGQRGVPLLAGTNANEANLYQVPTGLSEAATYADAHAVAERCHPDPKSFLAAYDTGMMQPGELLSAITTAATFELGTLKLAEANPGPTYLYNFSWPSPSCAGALRACHCLELPFLFDQTDLPTLRTDHGLLGPVPSARRLVDDIQSHWLSFIRTGDPQWTEYSPSKPRIMVFDDESEELDDLRPVHRVFK